MVRIAEYLTLKLHGCDSYKYDKVDILSCIHFLTYSCNIVQQVALTSTCNSVRNIIIFFF